MILHNHSDLDASLLPRHNFNFSFPYLLSDLSVKGGAYGDLPRHS